MADRILTEADIRALVAGYCDDYGLKTPKVVLESSVYPHTLFIGTRHTDLITADLMLPTSVFMDRIMIPMLTVLKTAIEEPARPEQVRGETHGDYDRMSQVIQEIKGALRDGPKWDSMSCAQREALELIATKIGRIVCGDPNHPDHWADIAGYANLVHDRIPQPKSDPAKD